jgi:hypothetical protein
LSVHTYKFTQPFSKHSLRENLGVETRILATSTGLPGRNTKLWYQRLNNIIEAYTGNDVGHKEVSTS